MNKPATSELYDLLQKISHKDLELFRNFPDIARAGNYTVPREEVDYLMSEGFLQEKREDSFGKFFELSERARALLKNRE